MNQPHNRLNNPENPFESPVRNNIQIHQNQFETPPPDNNQDGQNLLPPLLNQNNRYNPDLFETPRRGNIPLFGNNLDVPNLQGSPPVPNGLNQRPSQRLFGVRRLRNRPHRDNAENDRPEVIAPDNIHRGEIFRQFGRNDDTSARIVTPPSVPRAINFLELLQCTAFNYRKSKLFFLFRCFNLFSRETHFDFLFRLAQLFKDFN